MELKAVLQLLERERNEECIREWHKAGEARLATYGIAPRCLRGIAREIGRDHELALQLWEAPNLDLRLLACLVEEPRQVTPAQLDRQVKDLCHATLVRMWGMEVLGRSNLATARSEAWAQHADAKHRACAWWALAQLARCEKDDMAFGQALQQVAGRFAAEKPQVQHAMAHAVERIAQRTPALMREALALAKGLKAAPAAEALHEKLQAVRRRERQHA